MRTIVELRLDLVARAAFTPMVFFARIFRERIAALNHEALDHAMKAGAVVKSFFRERFEIFDRSGRDLGPEFNDHFAFSRSDHGHFLGVARGLLNRLEDGIRTLRLRGFHVGFLAVVVLVNHADLATARGAPYADHRRAALRVLGDGPLRR